MTRRDFVMQGGSVMAAAGTASAATEKPMAKKTLVPVTSVHRVEADGITVFYREAGAPDAPSLDGIQWVRRSRRHTAHSTSNATHR